jgi:hypothetical protein
MVGAGSSVSFALDLPTLIYESFLPAIEEERKCEDNRNPGFLRLWP